MQYLLLFTLFFSTITHTVFGQNFLSKSVYNMDTIAMRKEIRKQDKHFSNNWLFEKASIDDIDHSKKGYVLTWKVKKDSTTYFRTFVFNLNSKFVTAYEQRFTNDTLLSQGSVELKNNEVLYIEQVIINKKSLKKSNAHWSYEVDGYLYEIFQGGVLMCIYKTNHLNHYYMLFEKTNKNDVQLVLGKDCLGIIDN